MTLRATPLQGFAQVPKARWGVLGALAVLGALGLVLVAEAVSRGIAAVVAGEPLENGALWIGVVGVTVRAVATWASQVAAARTASGIEGRLRLRLVEHVVAGPGERVGRAAILATRGLDDLDAYYRDFLPAIVGAACVPPLVGARILYADPLSAGIIVLCVPLVPVFMSLIGKHTAERVRERADALAALSNHLVELARGLPVLVGLGRVGDQTGMLRGISERHRRSAMATLRIAFVSALALELIATISVAVVAVFIGLRLVGGSLGLQTGLVVLVLAPECFLPFRRLGSAFHASEDGLEALRRAEETLATPPLDGPDHHVGTPVRVQGLTVRYSDRNTDAVADLSFTAPTGEVTLLAGPSGSGKSTVLRLLAGLRPADATIHGTLTTPTWVAWLPQHPQPVAATPRAELHAHGIDDPDEARELLERVGLADAMATDTLRLSPGEMRRLAFARVLARVRRGAALVVLDEPTAHLDPVTAARVHAEIAALRRNVTVVVASHDPRVQRLADSTVRLVPDDVAGRAGVPGTLASPAPTRSAPRSRPATSPDVPSTRHGTLGELAAFLRPVRWRFLAAAAIAAAASGFAIALTAVSAWLIVRAGQGVALMYLIVAIVGVRFFGVGRAVLHYVDRLVTHDATFRAATALRLRLWGALARKGPADRALLGAGGTLGTLVADADEVRDLAPRVVTPILTAVLVWLGAAVGIGLLLPVAGMLVVTIGLVALVVPGLVGAGAGRRARAHADALRAELLSVVAATYTASDDVRGNDVTSYALARIHRLDTARVRADQRATRAAGLGDALVVACCGLLAFAMFPVAVPATGSGAVSAAVVAVLVLTPLGLIEPFTGVVQAVTRWPVLAQILRRLHGVTARVDRVIPGDECLTGVSEVALDAVAYRYPGTDAAVFEALDVRVRAGQWLVVTGPSGSGKSTLLALLLRHLEPTAGRYLLDGEDVHAFDVDSVRRHLAWCPQEAHLFDSTLQANLVIARPRDDMPDDAELEAVLAQVGLGPWLTELDDGLDTRIGPAGARLSGGQRARLAVARTLLTRAEVILLDEPTAHLDEPSAARLLADLRTALADKVTVLVTHAAIEMPPGDRHLDLGAGSAVGLTPDGVGQAMKVSAKASMRDRTWSAS